MKYLDRAYEIAREAVNKAAYETVFISDPNHLVAVFAAALCSYGDERREEMAVKIRRKIGQDAYDKLELKESKL